MSSKRKDRKVTLSDSSVLHFPLGPLGGFSTDKFLNEKEFKELDAFVLTLAHVYNDLKSSLMFSEINSEFTPPKPAEGILCKFYGQNAGIGHYCFRLQVGIMVELLGLIKKHRNLFNLPTWKKLLEKLKSSDRQQWLKLLAFADDSLNKNDFTYRLREFLIKVRSNGGYHYYQTKPLAGGFLKHFSEERIEAKYAYASIGKSFEETRFFFADAAITAMTNSWRADLGKKFDKEFRNYLIDSHKAIRTIVLTYMRTRSIVYTPQEHQ